MQSGPDGHDGREDNHGLNPMNHPEEQGSGADGSPRFGRLLAVLAAAVALIGIITMASEAYFSP